MKRALLLFLLAACGPHIAESVVCGDAGCPPPRGRVCEDNQGCEADHFCEKQHCSDEKGHCAPTLGGMCSMNAAVCGCDLQPYANDCARREAGIAAFTPGPCQ